MKRQAIVGIFALSMMVAGCQASGVETSTSVPADQASAPQVGATTNSAEPKMSQTPSPPASAYSMTAEREGVGAEGKGNTAVWTWEPREMEIQTDTLNQPVGRARIVVKGTIVVTRRNTTPGRNYNEMRRAHATYGIVFDKASTPFCQRNNSTLNDHFTTNPVLRSDEKGDNKELDFCYIDPDVNSPLVSPPLGPGETGTNEATYRFTLDVPEEDLTASVAALKSPAFWALAEPNYGPKKNACQLGSGSAVIAFSSRGAEVCTPYAGE